MAVDDIGAGALEELDEELGGKQGQIAAPRETDVGYLAGDDDLAALPGRRSDCLKRRGEPQVLVPRCWLTAQAGRPRSLPTRQAGRSTAPLVSVDFGPEATP